MLQTQTAVEKLDDGLYELERAVQGEIEKREKAEYEELERIRKENEASGKQGEGNGHEVKEPAPKPVTVSKPKPVVEVAVSSVFNKVSDSVYLESEADIASFIEALKDELSTVIKQEKRVRIR